ncbi:acyltransferase [Cytophagaceae bacterium DM2B3-1]|uniref:Acyltransferase n=1 Tax=Xanthocytophaga flava TaxID=3048013 RepID=A0ABT7CP21_9BACT|nr:acyltransferase [Xanthocytophaga flavus]MDJ1494424.1 acyltransferase [Xanthocytophaga flavus]
METLAKTSARQYGLDWVRVGAFSLLIFYHTGMFFVTWDFHFKNPDTSKSMELWMLFMNQWRLPLLFLISGAGVSFALKKRSGWQFTKERFVRLFIPIVFGMLVIVPPQIYMERLYKHQFTGSYLDFYPSVFNFVPYPEGGSLSWHHLWFIVYLFFYCLIGLPLFLYLRKPDGQRLMAKVTLFVQKYPLSLFLLAVPIEVYYITLYPKFEITHGLTDDWFNHAFSFTMFVYGYILALQPTLLESIKNIRKVSLIGGIVSFLTMLVFVFMPYRDYITFIPKFPIEPYDASFLVYFTLKSFNLWFWILAIIGYALHSLNFSNRFLTYANEAVYPFYILHQTVMLIIGYYIIQWNMSVIPKFFLIAVGMFVITALIYEFGIRRWKLTRVLFGLKPQREKLAKAVSSANLTNA